MSADWNNVLLLNYTLETLNVREARNACASFNFCGMKRTGMLVSYITPSFLALWRRLCALLTVQWQ